MLSEKLWQAILRSINLHRSSSTVMIHISKNIAYTKKNILKLRSQKHNHVVSKTLAGYAKVSKSA